MLGTILALFFFLRWAAAVTFLKRSPYAITTVHNPFNWECLYYHCCPSRLATMVLHSNHVHNLIIIREQVWHWVLVFRLSIYLVGTLVPCYYHNLYNLDFCLAESAVLKNVSWLPTLITKALTCLSAFLIVLAFRYIVSSAVVPHGSLGVRWSDTAYASSAPAAAAPLFCSTKLLIGSCPWHCWATLEVQPQSLLVLSKKKCLMCLLTHWISTISNVKCSLQATNEVCYSFWRLLHSVSESCVAKILLSWSNRCLRAGRALTRLVQSIFFL